MGTAVSSVPSSPVDANTFGLMLFAQGYFPSQDPKPSSASSAQAQPAQSGQAPQPSTGQRLTYRTLVGGPQSNPWRVQWQLAKKSPNGGWVVQHVTVTAPNGTALYSSWDAWQVRANSEHTIYFPDYDDTFQKATNLIPTGATVEGQARFYEGLLLPFWWVGQNSATLAGDLRSTTINPQFSTKNATASVDRTWVAP